jgi:signal transduction histidine kinase
MTIRFKLLLIYGALISLLLAAGAYSIVAVTSWNRAAEDLSLIHEQRLMAEMLRADINRQINYALDFLLGDSKAESSFRQSIKNFEKYIAILNNAVQDSSELEYISSLEETRYELVWIMEHFFKQSELSNESNWRDQATERLSEIGDEVSDDVASLNLYYRFEEDKRIDASRAAGEFATVIIVLTAIIAVFQFIALAILSQRWLVRPIGNFNKAAEAISNGDFEFKIDENNNDEWGKLAADINNMAKSLKTYENRLLAHERSEVMDEFAAYASHNIRNPLAGIRAAAQVAFNENKDLSPDSTETFSDIINTIDRLDAWLKRLLEFAAPLDLEIKLSNINDLVKEAIQMSSGQYTNKSITVEYNLSENLPDIFIDPVLFEQAVAAIFSNAFDAVDNKGKIIIETSVFSNDGQPDEIQISIQDNGAGIPDLIRPKLFKAFSTSKDKGTGLGLAQAKKIINLHDGTIRLDSHKDSGTLVTMRLPVIIESNIQSGKS